MRVVVTGASGFLGRNALLRAPRDWDVVAVHHRATDLAAFAARHGLANVRAWRCDLTDAADVGRLAAEIGGRADAVLYFAANGDPAVSAEHPRHDLHANALALVTFLERVATDHVVFASSGAVYDGSSGPVTPDTKIAPVLPYAISKLASEQYLRFFAEKRGTVGSYVNVRFFGAYGPYEAERKITTRWLRGMAAGQREFVIRGDGKNLIDFMHVDDAIDGYLTLLRARGTSVTLDFASGAPTTIDGVAEAMATALGIDITIRHEGIVPEYIEFHSVDTTMRERYGFVPRISFTEGFRRFKAFFDREAPASSHA